MTRPKSAYPLRPPRERGTLRAFTLAALMHVLLGFFLYHGIQWQNSTPAGAEAELWTEVPDLSTPRPAPPPPAPAAPAPPVNDEEADIALQEKKRQQQQAARDAQLAEQQRQQQLQAQQEAEAKRQQQLAADQAANAAALKQKQKQQQQQADRLKQQQLADQQKQDQLKKQQEAQKDQQEAQAEAQQKADAQKAAKAKAQAQAEAQKKLDQERRARLAQMQGLAGGEGSTGNGLAKSGTGSGAGGTAASPGYAEKVQRRVRPNIVWAGDTQGLETVVSVRCAPTGTLLSATITRGSGNAQWDDAALRAVQRSDPMPQDTNGKTPASFTITLRPAG